MRYVYALACLLAVLACSPEGPFRRLENEINDLKVEVFRQRQEIEKLSRKAEEDEKRAVANRDAENRFRAETQEYLRVIRDHTQAVNNRLSSGSVQLPSSASRPAPRPAPSQPAAADLQPDDQQLALAEKDFNSGNFDGAVEASDNLIKYFPDSDNIPEALYLKGRALYALKSYGRAQEAFQRLCSDFPRSERFRASRLNIGRCQHAQGNTLAAIATLEDIIERSPNSTEARSANDLLQDIKSKI
jgi:TolA-binding protein